MVSQNMASVCASLNVCMYRTGTGIDTGRNVREANKKEEERKGKVTISVLVELCPMPTANGNLPGSLWRLICTTMIRYSGGKDVMKR